MAVDWKAIEWRPIGFLEMILGLIEGQAKDSAEFYQTLQKVRPGVLADADLARTRRAYAERSEWIQVYREQLQRWEDGPLTVEQRCRIEDARRFLDGDEETVEKVLALNDSLVSIERIQGMDAGELALRVLSGEFERKSRVRAREGT